jgi:8-oxo-dGTP diphosphatase
MNLAVKIENHLYTTDYFQMSAFNPDDQIISIYYFAEALEPITAPLRNKEFDFDEDQLNIYKETNEIETFRFVAWNKFSAETVTLPIDKIVAAMLKEKY